MATKNIDKPNKISTMNLYHISQDEYDSYDTYSDAVVAARSAKVAATISPTGGNERIPSERNYYGHWTNDPNKVSVEYIGKAKRGTKEGVICASFHAG